MVVFKLNARFKELLHKTNYVILVQSREGSVVGGNPFIVNGYYKTS